MDRIHIEDAKLFKAFCDENRLQILEMLRGGEKCACILLEDLNIGQSTLSYHMKILCDAGIVEGRSEGKWTHYSISEEGSGKAKERLEVLTAAGVSQEDYCCCCSEADKKEVVVDFLYLDLNTCERCMATDSTLDEALAELSNVLDSLGYKIIVNRVNITSREIAQKHRFLSSPTIRVNGEDICAEDITENNCKDCGDLCGSEVECRVFVYDGVEYDQPPKAMIIDGILKVLYSAQEPMKETCEEKPYTLPKNLEKFFASKDAS